MCRGGVERLGCTMICVGMFRIIHRILPGLKCLKVNKVGRCLKVHRVKKRICSRTRLSRRLRDVVVSHADLRNGVLHGLLVAAEVRHHSVAVAVSKTKSKVSFCYVIVSNAVEGKRFIFK